MLLKFEVSYECEKYDETQHPGRVQEGLTSAALINIFPLRTAMYKLCYYAQLTF